MSLFGDDEPSPARGTKSSLFDDDSQAKGSSSMFGDSSNDNAWNFTPRKTNSRKGPTDLVKTLLADVSVPEIYIDTWDIVARGRASISADEAKDYLKRVDTGSSESKIWNVVSSNGEATTFGRGQFNVLLALIGLAQEGEDLSLDVVDERKHSLPTPALPAAAAQTPANGNRKSQSYDDADPWGSPAMHKGHAHSNGTPQRTTSTFTTSASEPADDTTGGSYTGRQSSTNGASSWNSNEYTAAGSGGFDSSASGGFGGDEDPTPTRRPIHTTRTTTSKGVEEVVTVTLLEEKEGMFMFQHRNYEVASQRRNSKVIRRYSDFVWLLDCLHKRYPFRQLPLLPPKRVAINGNHIAGDMTFLEKRRRGLIRALNALVRHPVLREEQLVVMFLTVPTELAVWRKQATISVQEEFTGKPLPPTLEDSLPSNLYETFDTARTGIRRGAELYINLCTLVERLVKRKEAIASEYGRFNLNLVSITETTKETYAVDTNDVPLLNEGINSTAKHLSTTQTLLEDESRAWDQGFLEDLKFVRDGLVSMRELFDRRDRLARDNIPQLERRIQQNEQKLQNIKIKGAAAKPGEAEKVENAIVNDKQSIVDQHARGVFIKEAVKDELVQFQTSIYTISRLHQDWAQERVKYAELIADNFRGMVDAVEGMPLGE